MVDGTPPPVPVSLAGAVADQHEAGADLDDRAAPTSDRASSATTSTATAPSPAPRPGTTFNDTTLAVNGSFSYTVKAVDVAGNESAASSSAAVVWVQRRTAHRRPA